jgi:hypothetical protein
VRNCSGGDADSFGKTDTIVGREDQEEPEGTAGDPTDVRTHAMGPAIMHPPQHQRAIHGTRAYDILICNFKCECRSGRERKSVREPTVYALRNG